MPSVPRAVSYTHLPRVRGFSGRAGRDVRRGPGPGVRGQRLGRGSGVCIPRVLRKGRDVYKRQAESMDKAVEIILNIIALYAA